MRLKLQNNGRFRLSAIDTEAQAIVDKEFALGHKGWIDASTAARFGKKMKAEYSIASIIRPTRNDVEIYARLIDAKTNAVLAICDVYEYSEDGKDFESAYSRFVDELGQNFPVVGGEIRNPIGEKNRGEFIRRLNIFSKQDNIILGMGKDANIKEGMKFVAYSRDDPLVDIETGKILVEGKVNKVGELFARIVRQEFTHLEPLGRMKTSSAKYVVSK